MALLAKLKALFQQPVARLPRRKVLSYRLTCYDSRGHAGVITVTPEEMAEDQVVAWQQEMEYHRGLVTIVTRIYAP